MFEPDDIVHPVSDFHKFPWERLKPNLAWDMWGYTTPIKSGEAMYIWFCGEFKDEYWTVPPNLASLFLLYGDCRVREFKLNIKALLDRS